MKPEFGIGSDTRRRQQDRSAVGSRPGVSGPGCVADDVSLAAVVHRDPAQSPVVEHETARFDDVDRYAETGREAKNRAGILRDIRLKKGNTHGQGIAGEVTSRNLTCFQRVQLAVNTVLTIRAQGLQRGKIRLYRFRNWLISRGSRGAFGGNSAENMRRRAACIESAPVVAIVGGLKSVLWKDF